MFLFLCFSCSLHYATMSMPFMPLCLYRLCHMNLSLDSKMSNIIRCNCGVFKAGERDPTIQWGAEVAFSPNDINMETFKSRICKSLSLDKRCSEAGIHKFQVEILSRTYVSTQGHKSGRVYSIDSQESWDIALPELLKGERELVGKLYLSFVLLQ